MGHFFGFFDVFYYLCAQLLSDKVMKIFTNIRSVLTLLLPAVIALVVLSGCHSRQKIVYMQGAHEIGSFEPTADYEARIRPDQHLSIMVTCSDLQLAVPFNLQRPQASVQEGGGSYSTNYQDSENLNYYVDKEGCIYFPTIGRLEVAGMTRRQLSAYLCDYLIRNGYIADPIVNVSFNDLHYSILGEVNTPGMKPMNQERITLFEALATAGDMTIFGERDKVRLIRSVNGKEQVVALDLKDPQIVASPYYFVQSGDVIYVEPNATRAANREVSSLSSFAISITSILVTIASLVITVLK